MRNQDGEAVRPHDPVPKHPFPFSFDIIFTYDLLCIRSTCGLSIEADRIGASSQCKHLTLRWVLGQPLRRPQWFVAVGMSSDAGSGLYAPYLCFRIVRSTTWSA
jgi:hypothetical protein